MTELKLIPELPSGPRSPLEQIADLTKRVETLERFLEEAMAYSSIGSWHDAACRAPHRDDR